MSNATRRSHGRRSTPEASHEAEVYGIQRIYKKIFGSLQAFIRCLLASETPARHHPAVQNNQPPLRGPCILLMLAFLANAAAQPDAARGEEAFVDVSKTTGLNVRHVNGARGAKLLPETE